MKKIGVVGIPGKWSSEYLADVLQEKTGFRLLIPIDELTIDTCRGTAVCGNVDLSTIDALVVKKAGQDYSHHMLDRIELLRHLNRNGLRVFSDPGAILKAVDRLTCTLTLQQGNIPMPDTVITESVTSALEVVRDFGRAVFKPLFTSKARGMIVICDEPEACAQIKRFRQTNPVMYIQRMVDIPGQDLGLVFLGGDYIATYARVGHTDSWNTTTHSGGRYAPFEPSADIIDLGWRAQNLFGLDFTCVDIALTPDGPIVFEVSAFGGFRGLMEGCRIDAAQLYAQHIIEILHHGPAQH